VHLQALDLLGLAPQNTLAIEDSDRGVRASTAAGLVTVVVSNDYTADDDFTGAALVRRDSTVTIRWLLRAPTDTPTLVEVLR
jgi:beta-phosphoglucomutase-like phosphatase (HAD superfamily)